MTIYDDLRPVAADLLEEFHQGTIKFIRMVPGNGPAYDPGDPTPTEFSVNGVVRGVSKKFVNGTTIVESDMQVTFNQSDSFTPDMSDELKIDGVTRTIVAIKPVPPAGTPIVNIVIFR